MSNKLTHNDHFTLVGNMVRINSGALTNTFRHSRESGNSVVTET